MALPLRLLCRATMAMHEAGHSPGWAGRRMRHPICVVAIGCEAASLGGTVTACDCGGRRIHVLPSHDNLNKKEVIARLTVDKIVTFMQVQIADISEEDNILREVISNRVLSEVFNYGTMNAKKDIQKYRVF